MRLPISVMLLFLLAGPALASHFRFATISWRKAPGGNGLAVDITIREGYRAGAQETGGIQYSFGDGSGTFDSVGATLEGTATDLAGEQYEVYRKTVRHTYVSEGAYVVTGQSCCRLGTLQNAGPLDAIRASATIDLRFSNLGSPVANSPVILQMRTEAQNNVAIPIADPDADPFTVRLATSAESMIPNVPAIGTNLMTITSNGELRWNTVGGIAGSKYSVQIIVEENHPGASPGNVGKVPLDFIVELVGNSTNQPPACTGPSGAFNVAAGAIFKATFSATDPEGGPIRLSHQGLPTGATLTPTNNFTGASPLTANFEWRPASSDFGQSFPIVLVFTDNQGFQSVCTFSITVTEVPIPDYDLVSTNRFGTGSGNGNAANPVVSRDGRYVAFSSTASNLAPNDNNGKSDIFWRDRATGETRLVSINRSGASGNNDSFGPIISADGRFVGFQSLASDLVNSDGNGGFDVFVRDVLASNTISASISSNGNSTGSGDSYSPKFANNGRIIAFASTADNLVSNDTNRTADVFVRNLDNNSTTLASVSTNGTSGDGPSNPPVISSDGRYVAFLSRAGNLVANDTNRLNDVFRRDLQTGVTELVSANAAGTGSGNRTSFDPVLSDNGLFIAFGSQATDFVSTTDTNNSTDVFYRDMVSRTTSLASKSRTGSSTGDGPSGNPFLSRDGRFLVFITLASNIISGDANGKQDVVLLNIASGSMELISADQSGTGTGNGYSGATADSLSEDGNFIAFFSTASNLVSNDTNNQSDVFVRDRAAGRTILMSRPIDGTGIGSAGSFAPAISLNGQFVVFASDGTNLVNGDTNAMTDVFGVKTGTNASTTLPADLALSITVDPANPGVGTNVIVSVTLTNPSPRSVITITVTNGFAGGVRPISVSSTTGTVSTNNGTWVVSSMSANTSARATFTFSVTNVGVASFFTGISGTGQADTNTANNTASIALSITQSSGGSFIGPLPYTSRTNSPWFGTIQFGLTEVEDFEDGQLSNVGVSASTGSVLTPGNITDSVDADDGAVDGSGAAGRSYFSGSGSTGIQFSFNNNILGEYPREAGIVWTDGGGTVSFQAWDSKGNSLGIVGPFDFPDGSTAATTAEDRFFGITNPQGISAIKLSNTSGGIEVDHLQFTILSGVAAPAGLAIWMTGNGTVNSSAGNATADLRNGASFGPGLVGQAFQFDGSDDFAVITNTPPSLPAAVSVEFWINSATTLNTQTTFVPFFVMLDETADFATTARGLDFYYENGSVKFAVAQQQQTPAGGTVASTVRSVASHPVVLASNTWYHVAGTFNGGVQRLYYNGRMVTALSNLNSIAYTASPILLGACRNTAVSGGGTATTRPTAGRNTQIAAGGAFFSGALDEVSIYGAALSGETVSRIYSQSALGKVLPRLLTVSSGGSAELRWPSFHANYQLQQTLQLDPSPGWNTVAGVITTNGGYRFPISSTNGSQYYRLHRPVPLP